MRRPGIRAVAVLAVLAAAAGALAAGSREQGVAPGPATLAGYWAGDARWELAGKWTGTQLGQDDPYSGAHIEVSGARWYLFNRAHRPGTCPDGELRVGVQVRESADHGATWSAPVPILEPTPGSPWSCAASDGDAYYDADRGTWRYLFQCKTETSGWQGCYAERADPSPMGPFAAPAGAPNPVIGSGELWGQICDAGDDCDARQVREEGTFNIFRHDADGFWISFHGAGGSRMYRGIARTADFTPGSFVVDQPSLGLPSDAILDAGDAAGFREDWAAGGPVGAGAGTIVTEGEYLYALNEFFDSSLSCVPGQTWDLGMFRSRSAASTSWEPFPGGNPIVRSSRAPEADGQWPGCNVLYPTLFRDTDGSWYLMHGRMSSDAANNAIYVYRLVADPSVLVNGDVHTCDPHGWARHLGSAATLSSPRLPNLSPDGTCYLAFSCGASACPQSTYQDVAADPSWAGAALAFGGQFRSEGGSGSLELDVHQIGADGSVIRTDKVPIAATGAYAWAQGSGQIAPGAQTLRYELSATTPGTFGVDNLYLNVGV